MHRQHTRTVLALGLAIALFGMPAGAHEKRSAGKFTLNFGWGDEPAFTGSRNSIVVSVADATGAAVPDLGGGSLSVEVTFGDQRVVLPLEPAGTQRGAFRAWLLPTRAGTYSFHITGKIKDQPIDVRSTCSDNTFDCVVDAAALHFPVKDPSAGQLAESMTRALPRTDRAVEAASSARRLAVAALAIAVAALAAAVGLVARRGTKGA